MPAKSHIRAAWYTGADDAGGAGELDMRPVEQIEKVLNVEREIKRAQLGLMVRLKGKLTPDQQAPPAAVAGKTSRKLNRTPDMTITGMSKRPIGEPLPTEPTV